MEEKRCPFCPERVFLLEGSTECQHCHRTLRLPEILNDSETIYRESDEGLIAVPPDVAEDGEQEIEKFVLYQTCNIYANRYSVYRHLKDQFWKLEKTLVEPPLDSSRAKFIIEQIEQLTYHCPGAESKLTHANLMAEFFQICLLFNHRALARMAAGAGLPLDDTLIDLDCYLDVT